MIVRSGGRDVALQSSSVWPAAWPYSSVPPAELVGGGLLGAQRVQIEQAVGIPALISTLLLVSRLVSGIPLKVYRGRPPERQVADDSWQYELLHDRPSIDGLGASAFYADAVFSLAGAGYTCFRKHKNRDRVFALELLDATKVRPKREVGKLVFDVRDGSNTKTVDQREIIYVRGPAMPGSDIGLSPIMATRLGITTALKRQLFEGRYFDRNAEPRTVLAFPERMDRTTAQGWVEMWEEDHGGPENWHSTAAIGGGATVTTLPISLADAQFVEANQFTASQIGAMYGITNPFLNLGDNTPSPEDWSYLVTAGLGWVLTAIAQAFSQDRDLFPIPSQRLMAEHVVEGLTKADMKTRFEAYHKARQAGIYTANEIRAKENEPPHPDGNKLQVIPVGGGESRQQD